MASLEKTNGVFYTPAHVAQTLVSWVVRSPDDRLLDPSCGDGQFLQFHRNSIGVELDWRSAVCAGRRARGALIHVEDFFSWAEQTKQRFDCAAGNPPFIRYQRFAGNVRTRALEICARAGASFSGLSSSWAPFIVAASSLLKSGGRIAFVVPSEIGHSSYAPTLLEYLCDSFKVVHVIAIRSSVFSHLSQDVWLLYADGFGNSTDHFLMTRWDRFREASRPPNAQVRIALDDWISWSKRLRPFLLPNDARALYQELAAGSCTYRFGSVAQASIGYVSGDNAFFHLRPSQVCSLGIDESFVLPTVRSGRLLSDGAVSQATVAKWISRDDPCLLLRLRPGIPFSQPIKRYLESEGGLRARGAYKCRNRNPWYVVPDVTTPDGFLTYMSGNGTALVENTARCACTNSVHAVRMKGKSPFRTLAKAWRTPFAQLSAEVEGHPLGGGMLKLEPREAARVLLPVECLGMGKSETRALQDGLTTMRRWRHYE